jgi:hypothetical protein
MLGLEKDTESVGIVYCLRSRPWEWEWIGALLRGKRSEGIDVKSG